MIGCRGGSICGVASGCFFCRLRLGSAMDTRGVRALPGRPIWGFEETRGTTTDG